MPRSAIIETDHHRIDLLFTDLGFGNDAEGGLTIAAAFSKARPGVPVLYATARELTDGMKALFVEPHGLHAEALYLLERLKTSIANLLS